MRPARTRFDLGVRKRTALATRTAEARERTQAAWARSASETDGLRANSDGIPQSDSPCANVIVRRRQRRAHLGLAALGRQRAVARRPRRRRKPANHRRRRTKTPARDGQTAARGTAGDDVVVPDAQLVRATAVLTERRADLGRREGRGPEAGRQNEGGGTRTAHSLFAGHCGWSCRARFACAERVARRLALLVVLLVVARAGSARGMRQPRRQPAVHGPLLGRLLVLVRLDLLRLSFAGAGRRVWRAGPFATAGGAGGGRCGCGLLVADARAGSCGLVAVGLIEVHLVLHRPTLWTAACRPVHG